MQPDKEPINRLTAPYLQLAQYGLFVHDLRGYYVKNAKWEIQVSMLVDIPADVAKACIAGWLETTYLAQAITFYRRTSDKENQFRASFDRKDC